METIILDIVFSALKIARIVMIEAYAHYAKLIIS